MPVSPPIVGLGTHSNCCLTRHCGNKWIIGEEAAAQPDGFISPLISPLTVESEANFGVVSLQSPDADKPIVFVGLNKNQFFVSKVPAAFSSGQMLRLLQLISKPFSWR